MLLATPTVLLGFSYLGHGVKYDAGHGCTDTGGPSRATPHSRSGGAAVRKYPMSKVRSSSFALLEQP